MKRYFFFALLFPPLVMDLLLIQARPESVFRFILAGYLVAVLPAIVVALADEYLERSSLSIRALGCMLAGFVSVLAVLMKPSLMTGLCGALAAAVCSLAFQKLTTRKLLMLPSPEHFARLAGSDASPDQAVSVAGQ